MSIILIADDDDFVRTFLKDILEQNGHTVILASNDHECKDLMRTNKYDLILLDMVMPEGGGLNMLVEIREELDNARVILMSGYFAKKDVDLSIYRDHFKVINFLDKPITRNQLLYAVEEALTIRRGRKRDWLGK
jgi:DNA-binding NtrC family response regulator